MLTNTNHYVTHLNNTVANEVTITLNLFRANPCISMEVTRNTLHQTHSKPRYNEEVTILGAVFQYQFNTKSNHIYKYFLKRQKLKKLHFHCHKHLQKKHLKPGKLKLAL